MTIPSQRKKKCSKCGEVKTINNFPTHSTSSDGYGSYCKDCRNKLHILRREKDPVARLKHHIATRVEDQLKVAGIPKPSGLSKNLEEHLGYPITRLKRYLTQELKAREGISLKESFERGYHLDHKYPLSRFTIQECGDAEFKRCWDMENLQMISAEANLKKGAKVDEVSDTNGTNEDDTEEGKTHNE